MKSSNWQFFISGRHRRLVRMWQALFAGWGLIFTIILGASPFVFKNMTWTILEAVDIDSVRANNLSMQNLAINGIDRAGSPFSVRAKEALQKFAEPGVLYFTRPVAVIERVANGKKIKDNIIADSGRWVKDRVVLDGNVLIKSSDGSSVVANEMVIDLK